MLIRIGDEAYVPSFARDPKPGLRLVSASGAERHVDIGDRKGALIAETDGTLVLHHSSGVSLIDASNQFSVSELSRSDDDFATRNWTSSAGWTLVDSKSGVFREFELDREALNPLDPGYSIPSGTAVVPGTCDIVVTISRDSKFALVNVATGTYRFVDLPNQFGGSKSPYVDGDCIWVVNYDTLCRVSLQSLAVVGSNRLQPSVVLDKTGREVNAFLGAPCKSHRLGGWLVPRPYSSDVLLVDETTLHPIGRIPTGGKPYSLVEFDNGELLILDYPFDRFQTAHVRDLESL
jgi:hypothetical protein